jgi:hypothetical protein
MTESTDPDRKTGGGKILVKDKFGFMVIETHEHM